MGADIPGEHARHVLSHKGRCCPYEAGSSIINTASINADKPNPTLLAYATTKGAIQNFTAGLAQMLAEKGIRVNARRTWSIWTPLIPATMPSDAVTHFGEQWPMKRPANQRNWRRPM